MRKWILLFILGGLVFGSMIAHADVSTTATIWQSSFTQTNDTAQQIRCTNVVGTGGCKFHGIVVASTGTVSSITIYNSSSTAVNPVTIIDTDLQGPYYFDVYLSSGLVYTTAGTTPAKVNILYGKPTLR